MTGKLFINGDWIGGAEARFESHDPATGAVVWQGNSASAPQLDEAIAAAQCAQPSWAALGVEGRAEIIERFGESVRAGHAALTELICHETGKPRWEALTETDAVIGKIAASREAFAQRRTPAARDLSGVRGVIDYRAHGVVAVLGPFNFPAHLPNGHILPALLAGNCAIFKPSELTPGVAEAMVRHWERAGVPRGVLSLVHGGGTVGSHLVKHPRIDGVFFTGSFQTGQAINRALADHPGKIAALEMGGNNPLVVHGATDATAAALCAIQSAYLSAGQRCSCARRLIVCDDDPTVAPFLETLKALIGSIRVGDFTQTPAPFMGPVINDAAADRLHAAQREMVDHGGDALVELRGIGRTRAMLSPGLIDNPHQSPRRSGAFRPAASAHPRCEL